MNLKEDQFNLIKNKIKQVKNFKGNLYNKKLSDIDVDKINSKEDFESLPFTSKEDLRKCYPLKIAAVPEEEIVRIHSSSGTTGTPVIIPYTKTDVEDWAKMFKRCYEMAGMTKLDRVQITPGYGLWTAGIGFQAGAELLGSMVIPMGPGNTEKQIQMMVDMKSTVLCSTSSYALLLAEEIEKRGIKDKIHLKKGIIGSERWGDKMRNRISRELDIELYDVYGLTEIYGPGIGISCDYNCGIHYWDDYLYFEIIDPKTGKVLPDGEFGELVITTLRKEGAPLIRYRTRDLTRIIPGQCHCGNPSPRIDIITGRTDDMVKVKGVNIYPGQIEDILKDIDGASCEYQVIVDHYEGRDRLTLYFETDFTTGRTELESEVRTTFKSKVGLTIEPEAVSTGELPRSEKKTKRIFDKRFK